MNWRIKAPKYPPYSTVDINDGALVSLFAVISFELPHPVIQFDRKTENSLNADQLRVHRRFFGFFISQVN